MKNLQNFDVLNQNTVFWGLLLHDKKMPIWILSLAVSKPANKNEEYRDNGKLFIFVAYDSWMARNKSGIGE